MANQATTAPTDTNIQTSDVTNNNVSTSKHGFVPKAPNVVTQFLDGTGAFSTPAGGAGGLAVFGDGSDGTVTFDGSTTILTLVPSANVYTLGRDLFLAAGTINNGVSIITNGFRIFCQGALTNNGTIQWNGTAGLASAGSAAAVTNANSPINSLTNAAGPSTSGGTTSVTNGGNGVAGTTISFGGAGGNAGAGSGGTAGTGGTITANAALDGSIRSLPWALTGQMQTGAIALVRIAGGAGGGAGGGDTTSRGGGGGAGGGIVIVSAKTFAGTGGIQAKGGAAANAGGGNAGGGGGGGGGVVIVVSSSVSGGAISGQTITAAGGAHGTKLGSGSDGSDGSSGSVVLIPN